jgi:general secretion pathway protein L
MVSPTTSGSAGDFRTTASALLAEWRGELSSFAQEAIATPIARSSRFVRVDVGSAQAGVNLVTGDNVLEIGRTTGPAEDCARELSVLFAASEFIPRGTTDVVVRLPQNDVLRRRFELPAASRATLAKAIPFELERLSPIELERLYFDFAVVNTGKTSKQVEVELRIVKRTVVDQAVALVQAAGLNPASIMFEGDAREADWRAFPVDKGAYLRLKWRRWNVFALAGLAIALGAMVIFAAYLRSAAASDALAAEVEAASERTVVIHRLAHDIRDVRAQIEFPLAQKRASLFIAILSEVTRVLPDGTWLTELSVDGNKAHIQGFSKSASDIVGQIDRSPLFANAQFVAPLQSAQDGAERFDLSFDVKGGSRS